jgi:hypothetical protein
MTKNFILLLQHEEDALILESLMCEHKIFYEYDVIGSNELIYEFEINKKFKKIINILLEYNDITVLKFISN